MDSQELLDLKETLAERVKEFTRLEGQLENIENQIKNELHFDSFEDAQNELVILIEKEKKMTTMLEKKLNRIKEKYPQLLS